MLYIKMRVVKLRELKWQQALLISFSIFVILLIPIQNIFNKIYPFYTHPGHTIEGSVLVTLALACAVSVHIVKRSEQAAALISLLLVAAFVYFIPPFNIILYLFLDNFWYFFCHLPILGSIGLLCD